MKISKNRFEAFSDGILAIIITIMVLDIPIPEAFNIQETGRLISSISTYFVSFFIVGSYWQRHYRLFNKFKEVSNKIIWRNLVFLFLVSLIPIFTKWVMRNPDNYIPLVGYMMLFTLTTFAFHSMFRCAVNEYLQGKSKQKFSFWHLFVLLFIFAIIFILSVYFPHIAYIFLMGLLLLSSLLNLWFEHDPPENPEN